MGPKELDFQVGEQAFLKPTLSRGLEASEKGKVEILIS
jgi:hypothetical protein